MVVIKVKRIGIIRSSLDAIKSKVIAIKSRTVREKRSIGIKKKLSRFYGFEVQLISSHNFAN